MLQQNTSLCLRFGFSFFSDHHAFDGNSAGKIAMILDNFGSGLICILFYFSRSLHLEFLQGVTLTINKNYYLQFKIVKDNYHLLSMRMKV